MRLATGALVKADVPNDGEQVEHSRAIPCPCTCRPAPARPAADVPSRPRCDAERSADEPAQTRRARAVGGSDGRGRADRARRVIQRAASPRRRSARSPARRAPAWGCSTTTSTRKRRRRRRGVRRGRARGPRRSWRTSRAATRTRPRGWPPYLEPRELGGPRELAHVGRRVGRGGAHRAAARARSSVRRRLARRARRRAGRRRPRRALGCADPEDAAARLVAVARRDGPAHDAAPETSRPSAAARWARRLAELELGRRRCRSRRPRCRPPRPDAARDADRDPRRATSTPRGRVRPAPCCSPTWSEVRDGVARRAPGRPRPRSVALRGRARARRPAARARAPRRRGRGALRARRAGGDRGAHARDDRDGGRRARGQRRGDGGRHRRGRRRRER